MAQITLNCPYCGEEFKKLFAEYLSSQSHERTAGEILSCVRSICNFAQKDFIALGRGDVDEYFCDMAERGLSSATIRIRQNRYSVLVRFLNERLEKPIPNYFDMIRYSAPQQEELSQEIVRNYVKEDEFRRLIAASAEIDKMAEVIFKLSYYTAMSASEICSMRHDHLSRGADGLVKVFVYDESFHEERTITLDKDLGDLLDYYVVNYSREGSAFVFQNKHGHQLTLRNVSALFRKCCRLAGLSEGVSFKDLRSSAVIRLLKQSDDSAKVAEDANLRTARINVYKLAKEGVHDASGFDGGADL